MVYYPYYSLLHLLDLAKGANAAPTLQIRVSTILFCCRMQEFKIHEIRIV